MSKKVTIHSQLDGFNRGAGITDLWECFVLTYLYNVTRAVGEEPHVVVDNSL